MTNDSLIKICVLLIACVPISGYSAEPPLSVPIEVGIAIAKGDNTIELSRFVVRTALVTVTEPLPDARIEVKKGSIKPSSRTDVLQAVETQTVTVDLARVTCSRVDGAEVSAKALLKELVKPTTIIVANEGVSIDPKLLKVFKAESLILKLPKTPPAFPAPDP